MRRPGGAAWFLRHEMRLAWRDWLSMMTAGKRRGLPIAALGLAAFAIFMHGLAYAMILGAPGLDGPPDGHTLLMVSAALIAGLSLMLSQALESVTRAFYARGDLALILTSPATAGHLFAVRIAALAVTTAGMALLLAAPFINILIWFGGAHWAGAYAAILALAMASVAAAAALTILLFRTIGPRRTRGMAQVLAAVIGAAFAITLQLGAILSFGTLPSTQTPRLAAALIAAPGPDHPLWWPARAVMGQPLPLAELTLVSILSLVLAIVVFAPRFGRYALAASEEAHAAVPGVRPARFHAPSPAWALRRKEWTLLVRDPWLMSQTLMQLLYLLPAAFLVWRNFQGAQTATLIVPMLIVAAGQLAGGLAWLAVSGEDAPDLIASAPVPSGLVLRARTEAVLGAIAAIFAPFVALMSLRSPAAALTAMAGVAVAAVSSTAIQYWFRSQARRSLFRRRQTSSRVATFAEALSSTFWAGTGALLAAGTWLALVPGAIAAMILAAAWLISPARAAPARPFREGRYDRSRRPVSLPRAG